MSLAKKASIFAIAWFLLYILVYFVFIAPNFIQTTNKQKDLINNSQNSNQHNNLHSRLTNVINTIHDPFVPEECLEVSFSSSYLNEKINIGIIIVVHDENPKVILRTIKSVHENSQDLTLTIVIVDDHSVLPVKEWPEWKTIDQTVTILRTQKHRGISESRNFAIKHLKEQSAKLVVFLDAGAIVSNDWLLPLVDTLVKHPKSVVYPAIDLLEDHTGTIYPADNVIAAIDWSLKLVWEIITPNSQSRIPLLPPAPISRAEPLYSPGLPSSYAIQMDFLTDIGGLATSSLLSSWGSDNIELALRVWLCTEGSVIRQPCSRIAIRRCTHEKQSDQSKSISNFDICSDSGTMTGYTQYEGDRDALSLAELWLVKNEYRDTVYKHRMIGRLPYQVILREDARHPAYLNDAKLIDINKCNNFDWYLQQIYPGLLNDKEAVTKYYERSTSPLQLAEYLSPVLEQYNKKGVHLLKESNKILAPNSDSANSLLKFQVQEQQDEKIRKKIREEHLCLNFNDEVCAKELKSGGCKNNLGITMFGCPKSCGFCSPDNKLCIDFYLKKCPEQASQGQCTNPDTKDWMEANCMRSCHICRQINDPPLPNEEVKQPPSNVNEIVKENLEHPKVTTEEEKQQYLLQNLIRIDPYVSQKQWIEGKLPDPVDGDTCALKGTDHAKLLNYIHVEPDIPLQKLSVPPKYDPNGNNNRIFCAVYTMESAHDTNIKIMKATWAKRCDGWVAFSTATDESIPAIEIHHEGAEEYNNMWQKSRSIWKYIAHHYKDEFDWFLIGGDDMYYIVNNLRKYLSSDEVTKARNKKEGMFLGRRFFPPNQIEFNSGGAGYILDQVSLQVLADHLDGAPCFPHQRGFWEDVNIANCLSKTHNIKPFDTRDEHGRERFHPFQPANHLLYTFPKNPDWYQQYNPNLKLGLECCATDSVSFHYAKAPFMQKLHNYLYNCPHKKDLEH